jgi:CheY-like chemotaxis protein
MPVTAQAWSPVEVTAPNPADCGPLPASETAPGKGGGGPAQRGGARKILILDDDQEFLDTYSRILARLPSHPEVRVAVCATRALALLEAEPFALLITDLRMPKIDGFQVLLSARRRFPTLKTVAITGLGDQQYRARAYASGIDLYTEKPTTPTEIRLFSECVDALLTQASHEGGFRGIQSKSLMDLIQIECLSQNSSVLRITRGSLEGRVWVQGGSVIDAELQGERGEEAFKQIFSWKTGHFEILPGEPHRPRTIYTAYESLLLDSAQTLDESTATGGGEGMLEAPRMCRTLQPLAGVRGVESLLLISGPGKCESWGVENPEEFAGWTHRVLHEFKALGEMLKAGPLRTVEAVGPVRCVVLLPQHGRELMAGLDRKLNARLIRAAGKELATHLGKE